MTLRGQLRRSLPAVFLTVACGILPVGLGAQGIPGWLDVGRSSAPAPAPAKPKAEAAKPKPEATKAKSEATKPKPETAKPKSPPPPRPKAVSLKPPPPKPEPPKVELPMPEPPRPPVPATDHSYAQAPRRGGQELEIEEMELPGPGQPSMPPAPPPPVRIRRPFRSPSVLVPAQPAARPAPAVEKPTSKPIISLSAPVEPASTAAVNLDQVVTLDLQGTQITSFIRVIADLTKTNWLFDPAISGTINMIGPQQMTLREAMQLLRSIMEFKGFTVEEIGNIRRVVPRAEGKFRNTELRLGGYMPPAEPGIGEDKLVTQVVRLKYRNASDMRGILVNFARDAAAIIPDVPTNSLFITDNGTYIHRLMKVIELLDTPDPARRVALIRLNYAFVKNIVAPLGDILKQTLKHRGDAPVTPAAPAAPAPPAPPAAAPPAPPPAGAPSTSLPGGLTILPDEADNTLLVIARPDEIEAIEEAVRVLDRDPGHTPQIRVVTVRYSDPEIVGRLVTDAFKSDPALNSSIKAFSVIPDKRTASLMITTYSPSMMQRVIDLVQRLDLPVITSGDAVRIYKLEYAEAKKVAEIINGLELGSTEPSGTSTGAAPGPVPTTLDGSGRPIALPAAARPKEQERKATVIADEATNSLVIVATRERFNQLTAVIKELDVVRPQVLVEVLIVRIDVDRARHLGLDFNAVNTSGDSARPFAIGSTGQLANLFTASGPRTGLNLGILDRGEFDIGAAARGDISQLSKIGILINVLQNDSRANILSSPKLLTGDNQEAKITVGSQVRIPQGSTLNAINTITNFVTEDLGVILQLTPRITKNDFVAMKIRTQIKNLVPGVVVAGIPVISNSDIETNITVGNETTIAMGGLIQEDERKTVIKIPLLGDIPILGKVFRDEQTNKTKSNLLIFMTPHIIRTNAEAIDETRRISPVLRHVKIKERKREDTTSPSDLQNAMNAAK